MTTEFLKLLLTDKAETSMSFLEWRTLMNGTEESNMLLIDGAIKLLNEAIGAKADGFSFDSETGELKLTANGTPIDGAVVTINLGKYYTKEEVDTILAELADSDTLKELRSRAVGNLTWDEVARELRMTNVDGTQIGDPIKITGGDGAEYDVSYNSETGQFDLLENDKIKTSLTIVGGGGGGGGGSTINIEMVTPSSVVALDGESAVIQYRFSSVDDDGDPLTGTYAWKIDGAAVQGATGQCVTGLNTFDITSYLTYNDRRFTLVITDSAGTVKTKNWTARKVDVRIESTFNDKVTRNAGEPIVFPYTPYGSGVEKVIHFRLDGVELDPVVLTLSAVSQDYTLPAKEHGAHLLDVWITAVIGNTEIETDHIYKDIICVDSTSDKPIIACINRCLPVSADASYDAARLYYKIDDNGRYVKYDVATEGWVGKPQLYYREVSANQYDSTTLTYVVYKPGGGIAEVTVTQDGVSRTETTEDTINTMAFRTAEAGTHTIVISVGDVSVGIIMEIIKLDIEIVPVKTGLAFDFNPSGYSNNSVDKSAPWADENNSDVSLTVSDGFDWNNGGFLLDEDGNAYFGVKAGDRAYLSYNLFGTDMKSNGAHYKLIFKTENVKDINATFLSCMSGGVGLEMKAHNAVYSTSLQSLDAPISEEDTIEFEYNVEPIDTTNDSAKALIMIYEDGVAYRPMEYDNSHRLHQNSNPAFITIGSDNCDVRIYRMTANTSSLSDRNVISNFIADALSADEIIARYTRNQIYDAATGMLTPEALATACPNLKIIKIEAPRFTNSKSDKVPNTNIQCIHKGGDPILDNWYATGAQHSGQGTTSNEYGIAGRNIDLIMNKGAVITTGVADVINGVANTIEGSETVDKVSLTRNSVPTNYFNIKVNIASSENANNSLLAKRFNQFLPYTPVSVKKNSAVKTTMEFVNCVIFIRETASGTDSEGNSYTRQEFRDGEFHFYAIGNIGDSKKTDNSRACDPDDPKEFTNEILDNTLPNSVFDTGVVNLVVETLPSVGEKFTDYYVRKSDGTYTHSRYINNTWVTVESGITEIINGASAIVTSLPTVGDFEIDYYVKQSNGTYMMYRYSNGAYTDGVARDTVENDHMATAIAPEQWISGNVKYDALMADKFDKKGTYELRYMHDDGNLDECITVWQNFYKWLVTSTDTEFVDEFEDWFIKDAALYFYLFLERYTMTDNPSKNSFWHWSKVYLSTEEANGAYKDVAKYYTVDDEAAAINEGYRMDFWNYDNDTALGINNSGEMKMPYGKEFTDYFDDDRTKGYIFNGARSVLFRRMRKLMHDDLTAMYQNRESAGAWDSNSLINEFDAWQEQFPEELWRLDIERKYMRPYLGTSVDNSIPKTSDRFMKTMMNGRKKYHRRQFERDQSPYIGTKYLVSSVMLDQIMFRCNTPSGAAVSPDYTLVIVPYSDMYLSVKHGNSAVTQVRAKAGNTYTVLCPLTKMDDTAILIYSASRIQALNDLSRCYIHDNDFSNATKLQKLIIGSNLAGYSNEFLEKLTIGSNKLLEELDIRNCPNLTGSLNLSALGALRTLYASGTAINAVTFADNGKLEQAYLPAGITALTMRNLGYVETMEVSYDDIEKLIVVGGNLDTKEIASEITDTATEVYIGDIRWTLDSTDILKELYNIENCYLSGYITVKGSIGDYELANYRNRWADLTFNLDEATVVPHFTVKFYNYDETLLDTQYVVRGGYAENPVTREKNPIAIPARESDAAYVYTFSGWDSDPATTMISGDYSFYATYSTETRTYTVNWYNGTTLLESKTVLYGESAEYSGEIPEDTSLEEYLTYRLFDGWDKSSGVVTKNLDVYAKYTEATAPEDKALADMTPVELKALIKSGILSSTGMNNNIILSGDEFDLVLGHDMDFENVESHELIALGDTRVFDGSTVYVPKIDDGNGSEKTLNLFAEDKGFVLAIDFSVTASSGILASCYQMNGFTLRSTGSNGAVRYGSSNSVNVSSGTKREMAVIRKKPGDTNLYVYASNKGSVTYIESTLANSTIGLHNAPLSFGGQVMDDGYVNGYGSGTIYWAKVWMDDIGESNCKKLAAYPRYTITMQAVGSTESAYRTYVSATTGRFVNCCFMMKHLLDFSKAVNSTSTNKGGWGASALRTWLNSKIYPAIPDQWRYIMEKVSVKSNNGGSAGENAEITSTDDYLWIPCQYDMFGTTNAPYTLETDGERFNLFTDNNSRIKKFNNGNGSANLWWLRSPGASNSANFYHVDGNGISGSYAASGSFGVCFGFCI